MAVTHSTVVVVADDGTSPVGTDEWNDDHDTATVSLSGTSASKDQLLIPDTTAGAGLTIGSDTNLYRSAANVLKTDDAFVSTLGITPGVSASGVAIAFPPNEAMRTVASEKNMNAYFDLGTVHIRDGDGTSDKGNLVLEAVSGSKNQLTIPDTTAGAGLTIGADTNLYRSAADTLKTDDSVVVVGTIKQSTTKDVLDTDHTAAADPHSTYFKTISFGGNLA